MNPDLTLPALSAEAMAVRGDPRELMRLLELMVAAAVHCDNKGLFIEQIMGMGGEHQVQGGAGRKRLSRRGVCGLWVGRAGSCLRALGRLWRLRALVPWRAPSSSPPP